MYVILNNTVIINCVDYSVVSFIFYLKLSCRLNSWLYCAVDPAVMRPGRLDKVLYVGLPAAADREDILQALTKVHPLILLLSGKMATLSTSAPISNFHLLS